MSGPLSSLRVLEIASTEGSPAAFAGMALSDMGATVLRLDRLIDPALGGPQHIALQESSLRGRHSVAIDLKSPDGVETALKLVERSDVLIESFRPGVMERMGLGPDVCATRNRAMVFGRMTGWGQTGPRAMASGHTINFAALTGQLEAFVTQGEPRAPHNLLTDPSSIGMFFAFGLLSAVFEAQRSRRGQVVDAAILDCTEWFMSTAFGRVASMGEERIAKRYSLGSATHFHEVYQCADGRWISVTALENRARADLYRLIGISPTPSQIDDHDFMRGLIADRIRTRTRDEWDGIFRGSNAGVAPILSLLEAPGDEQNRVRGNFINIDGIVQPAPSPRFSRTPAGIPSAPESAGEGTRPGLREWGFDDAAIDALLQKGVVGQRSGSQEYGNHGGGNQGGGSHAR
jgi:alpha-methylacyl-CoA racemase